MGKRRTGRVGSARNGEYQDPRWQRLRLQVMERDGWCCVNCTDDTRTLHVHHKRYKGRVFDVGLDDLQTLCEECHDALGKHPRGGIWWEGGDFEGHMICEQCPECSSTRFKNKGSSYKCADCGWRPPLNTGMSVLCTVVESRRMTSTKVDSWSWPFSKVLDKAQALGDIGESGCPMWFYLAWKWTSDEVFELLSEYLRSSVGKETEPLALELLAACRRSRHCLRMP